MGGGKARTAVGRAPAKVNLHLAVTGRRSDGYHLLNSLMVPVSLCDTVAIEVARRRSGRRMVTCSVEGPERVGGGPSNLAARAARAVIEETSSPRAAHIRIVKRIPWGAGLGGGSSDAALVLKMLPALLGVRIAAPRMREIALSLGADVPFFLACRPAVAGGIGEDLVAITGFPRLSLMVVVPERRIETAWAYANALKSLTSYHRTSTDIRLQLRRGRLAALFHNDLEAGIRSLVPDVDRLVRQLEAAGARATVMSGSGSAVVGLFDTPVQRDAAGASIAAPDKAYAVEVLRGRPREHGTVG